MSATVDYSYQTVGFHFRVSIPDGEGVDARFQSVAGLEVQFDTENIKEGGENRFEHVLPVRKKYPDLVLKRGLVSPSGLSELTKWFNETFGETISIKTKNLDIELLNENHEPIMKWRVIHAWPKNWKIGELNAEKSEVLIETLELNYNRFVFEKV